MDVRVLEAGRLSADDVAQWRRIQESNPLFDSPFFSPEFTLATGAARTDAFVAIIQEQGEVRAFFPHHRLRNGVGKPIGGPISDYQGVISSPGFGFDVEELLAKSGLAAYDFNHALLAQTELSAELVAQSVSPRIDLSAGFESYAAARPKAGKHAIKETRRRMRKMTAEIGPVRFVYNDRDETAWRFLLEMKNASFEKMNVSSILDVPWVRRVLTRIRANDEQGFSGLLSTVYAGDRIVAAHLGMRSSRTWCWWFNTYDPALSVYAPGLIMILCAAEEAATRGLSAIDFGRGSQHYKQVFANDATELCEGSIARRGTSAGRLRTFRKTFVKAAGGVPLGRYESLPGRALSRLLASMRLPEAGANAMQGEAL